MVGLHFPPPYYTVETVWQRADQFNALRTDVFEQRYLLNATWWGGPGSPILLYTGGEGDGIESVFEAQGGYVLALARELRALVCFGEMRFFGGSLPFGPVASFERAPERLGLLSVEQALADYAHLVAHLRRSHDAQRSPVVALGSSLAGTLAFLLRAKYPHAVHAALASSAPVLGYRGLCDPFGWYRVATATFEQQAPGCVAAVRAAFTALLGAPAEAISRAFNTCTPATAETGSALAALLTDALAALATSAYPSRDSPVRPACAAVGAHGPGVGAFAPLLAPADGRCLDISQLLRSRRRPVGLPAASSALRRLGERARVALAPGGGGLGAALAAAEGEGDGASSGALGWYYLACTEVVHPIGANNVTDMFPPRPWSARLLAAGCATLFGVGAPRFEWLPESMGMAAGAKGLGVVTSRVVFTSGVLDPWSAQSVLRNASAQLVALVIADGAHGTDLGGWGNPQPDPRADSAPLVAARGAQLALLREWLRPVDDDAPATSASSHHSSWTAEARDDVASM
jgi:hypothetical protein